MPRILGHSPDGRIIGNSYASEQKGRPKYSWEECCVCVCVWVGAKTKKGAHHHTHTQSEAPHTHHHTHTTHHTPYTPNTPHTQHTHNTPHTQHGGEAARIITSSPRDTVLPWEFYYHRISVEIGPTPIYHLARPSVCPSVTHVIITHSL